MKKILLSLLILVSIFAFQLTFSGTIAEAQESSNSIEIIDGTSLSESELESIRDNEEYMIELTYNQALERAAEVSGKSIEELKIQHPPYSFRNPAACGWLETATTLSVRSYRPQLIVIVETCRHGSFGWVTKKQPFLQEFKAGSKKFDGTIKVDLDNTGYTYVVNGSFYDHGTVSHTGTTGIDAIFTATYAVSYASNWYGSLYTGLQYRRVIK
ncbi:hypothetical protein ACIQXG_00735 [Lysinibacillus sphaericus]|uniref:hypothetical protein n=1 Tax=Lysinibacillus sphaericus TaxID=1421 RepID=UPI0038167F20